VDVIGHEIIGSRTLLEILAGLFMKMRTRKRNGRGQFKLAHYQRNGRNDSSS
jgi:hypothetical protein